MPDPKRALLVSSRTHKFVWLDKQLVCGTGKQFEACIRNVGRSAFLEPLIFYITGPGGDGSEMRRILSCIEQTPRTVVTVVHGQACSAAFVLTQGGALRFAVPGAQMHFHRTVIELDHSCSVSEEICQRMFETIREGDAFALAYFLRRGHPAETITKLMRKGALIGTRKAKTLGLLDGLFPRAVFKKHQRIAKQLISTPNAQ